MPITVNNIVLEVNTQRLRPSQALKSEAKCFDKEA